MLSLKRIKRLEQRATQWQLRQQGKVSSTPIPDRWEDFVRLCSIRSGGQMKQFAPYPYQVLLNELMDRFTNIDIVKSRQLGLTQAVLSKFLHRACLSRAYSSMAFMRSGEDASALSRRGRMMLESLEPCGIQAENDNVGHLRLAGKGEIYFKNSSREGSRSYDSVQDFLFDEAAFSENIGSIYSASTPSSALAGNDTTKLVISTPSAKSGWYWDKLTANNGDRDVEELCIAVAEGKLHKDIPGVYWWVDELGGVKLILHWRCHPVYSQIPDYLQYRQQQDQTDLETILREYDLRFVDSAVSVFSADLVALNAIGLYEQERDDSASYFIGIDPNFGGNNFCTAPVLKWDGQVFKVVDCYRKRKETSDYNLYHLREIIKKWQPERVGVETNGGGKIYLEQLIQWFPKIDFVEVRTSESSKPVMISRLKLSLEREAFLFPRDCPLKDELLAFRQQGKRLEASPGKHDDYVMGSAIALTAASQEPKKKGFYFTTVPVR